MKQKESDYNELYKGVTRIVKTRENDKDVWFAAIGSMIVSRGTFNTKEDCVRDLEETDYEQICKIALAITTALKDYKPKKVEEV